LLFRLCEGIPRKTFIATSLIFIFGSLSLFWISTHLGYRHMFSMKSVKVIIIVSELFALVKLGRAEALVGSLLWLFSIVNFSSPANEKVRQFSGVNKLITSRKLAFDLTADWVRLMNRLDPERQAYLWYDSSGDCDQWSGLAAASHYWQGRVFNERFPEAISPIGEIGIIEPSHLWGRRILIMTSREDLMAKARENLRKLGTRIDCTGSEVFRSPVDEYFSVQCCTFAPLSAP